jgi:hypothetical protein
MAEPGKRGFGLHRLRRGLIAGTVGLVALLAIGAGDAGGTQASAKHRTHSSASPPTTSGDAGRKHHGPLTPQARTIRTGAGATVKRFEVSEPAGEIKLLRVTVLHGVRVRITGTIPKFAGVSISTSRPGNDPSESCRRQGGAEVCTQAEEACPMPMARWHFQLHKLAGSASEVRLEFAVR